jgi:hypothetical protein
MAVPAGRPSGVLTLNLTTPEAFARAALHVCGTERLKGNCGAGDDTLTVDAPTAAGASEELIAAVEGWVVRKVSGPRIRRRNAARSRLSRIRAR